MRDGHIVVAAAVVMNLRMNLYNEAVEQKLKLDNDIKKMVPGREKVHVMSTATRSYSIASQQIDEFFGNNGVKLFVCSAYTMGGHVTA